MAIQIYTVFDSVFRLRLIAYENQLLIVSSHPSSRFLRAELILGLARQASGLVEISATACATLGTTSLETPTGLDLEG